jgi:type IV pilus assembly protein PilF
VKPAGVRPLAGRIPALAGPLLVAAVLAACVTESTGGLPNVKPDLHEAARINTQLGSGYTREALNAGDPTTRRKLLEVALQKLQKAIDQDDDYAPAHAALAYVYALRGQNEDADAEYRRAIRLAPDDPDTRNNYGVFLCGQGKTAEADRNFMRAANNPNYATPAAAWTNAGVCARRAGDLARAESDFRQALAADPGFPDALAEMAAISFLQQNYLATRAFLERYQRLAKPSAALLALGARTERALGDERAAREYEIKLVRNFPDSPEAAQVLQTTTP